MNQRFDDIDHFNFYKKFIIDEDTKVRLFDKDQIEETNRIDDQIRNDRKNDIEFVSKYSTEKNQFLKELRKPKQIDYNKIYEKTNIKNALSSVSSHQRQLMKIQMN